jgi:hypothetical protein
MNTHQLVAHLVSAGIDPASVSARVRGAWAPLAPASHPGLAPINARQMQVLRSRGLKVARTGHPEDMVVGAAGRDPSLAHVFKGWNVWAVDQVDDLPVLTNPMMWGVSRDDQLRIWVEDQVRLHAQGASVADPIDLKGSHVEILAGPPAGLAVEQKKEDVPGDVPLMTGGPAALRYVRFFNRGEESDLPWPHDDDYLLDRTFTPSASSPATSGPGGGTIIDRNIIQPGEDVLKGVAVVFGIGVLGMLGYGLLSTGRSR